MAVRYAVATGNWSDTATWNGGTLPTSADDVYSNGFTVTIDQDVTVLSIRNTAQSPAVAGGGYILLDSYTLNSALIAGAVNLLTYSGSTSANINGSVTAGSANNAILFNSSNGTLNVVGNITQISTGIGIFVNSTGNLNIVGNITAGASFRLNTLIIAANATVNITGDISTNNVGIGSAQSIILITSSCQLNIVGNLTNTQATTSSGVIIANIANANINITGNLLTNNNGFVINSNASVYVKVVGSIVQNGSEPAVNSQNASAINIFTGPFVCSDTGVMPILVRRMNYFRTISSYFEFRDETTNGALPPASPAPATRLVSPDTIVDSPIPANVRHGVSYALGTFTGTLKVPSPDSVAKGVPTDNTVGTAALKPEDVWNYATANLTDANSIGARLKNCSTVETTGEQLEALL
jgi:hypothetical protein